MGSRHQVALIAIGMVGLAACADGGEGMVLNPGTGLSGTTGGGIMPPAGAGGMSSAPVAGMMAPPPTAGMSSAAGTGPGVAGVGASGIGGDVGTSGTGAPEAGTSGEGASGMGAAGMDAAGAGGTGGNGLEEGHCLAGITNFNSAGPFDFQMMRSGQVNMWVPNVPAGCKVPMVHLANGTGATCGTYRPSLERLASHGFIALCYESTQTGAGTQAVQAWDAALAMLGDKADLKFGSTGHSQGGQSSFCALRWAEEKWMSMGGVFAGLAMQPASGFGTGCQGGWRSVYAEIRSPMFMFSGQGTDGLVSQGWVQDGFNALADDIEAYHWAKRGGTHIPVPNGEEMQISIPWFRWKLLGDNEACKAFKAIRETDNTWTEAAVQNEKPCL